jgi:hypothetical protein
MVNTAPKMSFSRKERRSKSKKKETKTHALIFYLSKAAGRNSVVEHTITCFE